MCDYCPTCKTLVDGLVHEATTQTPQAGSVRNYRVVSSPVLNSSGEVASAIEMVEDVTEKLSLESQLRQSMKMEAIGRLAGGVAHDFNNMLGVILGNAEFAMGQMEPADPLFAALQEIRTAAGRSADLTRQLLGFARKQTVAPPGPRPERDYRGDAQDATASDRRGHRIRVDAGHERVADQNGLHPRLIRFWRICA